MLPRQRELRGRVVKFVEADNIIAKCTEGNVSTCRIRGKIKRRMRIRDNGLVFVSPWDFQSDRSDYMADILQQLMQRN